MWNACCNWFRKHAVNLVIVAVIGALYASTMVPQVRSVFYPDGQEPIYHGSETSGCAAIQCNVYQGAEYIPAMLEILRAHDAKITWNLGGLFVEDHPDLVREIYAAGRLFSMHKENGYE